MSRKRRRKKAIELFIFIIEYELEINIKFFSSVLAQLWKCELNSIRFNDISIGTKDKEKTRLSNSIESSEKSNEQKKKFSFKKTKQNTFTLYLK